jgi:catechol 2,3-dioxygenase-like lactoylglutathione lyase family enzyme
MSQKFDVGGVLLDQPFKIRRLGHFGFNLANMDEGRRFYVDLLGFKVSDVMDYAKRAKDPAQMVGLGDPNGYFTRCGTDHHAMVLFPKRVREALGRTEAPGITVNQITWQVGSLREVREAIQWFNERGVKQQRAGRDMPGSNWHTYIYDPDGQSNELYYGIEQVGWNGYSKPRAMYDRGFDKPPDLPQISEFDEVQQAIAKGTDIFSGHRHSDNLPAVYDVEGVLLPRPFKIVRMGPVYLFTENIETTLSFYRDTLGFTVTEETAYQGERCVFLRCNTEHHSVALLPLALREKLGFSNHSKFAALGFQLASYRQLRDAIDFLRKNGIQVDETIPAELHPGIEYSATARDPDGHTIQFYYAMEQIGWEGKPRSKEQRRPRKLSEWPQSLDNDSNAYLGEPFLGPWG